MLKSLFSGVSGLQSHQVAMDVESNNIANVNTVGYKYSRANFADLLAQTKAIATAPQGSLGGKNAVQVGLGSTVNSMTRIFSQGSVQNSDKNTDVAIQGDGFFIVSPDGGNTYKYTRAGDFKFDANGNFVDNNGFIAQGWLRDGTTGLVDATAPITNINIAPGLTTPANPTTEVTLKANLNSGPIVSSFSPAFTVNTGAPNSAINPGEGDALDDNGNPILSGDMGVMFNEVGEAFSLQNDQGVWISFISSSLSGVAVQASTGVNDELDISFTLDDGTPLNIRTNDATGLETAAENASRYVSAINAQTGITGVEANYNALTGAIDLSNTNGNVSASHNIRLIVNAGDNSGFTTQTSTTAYRYQYNSTTDSAIVNQDKTFTSIADLRYAMEVQAKGLNGPGTTTLTTTVGASSDSFQSTTTASNDTQYLVVNPTAGAMAGFTFTINGTAVTVAATGAGATATDNANAIGLAIDTAFPSTSITNYIVGGLPPLYIWNQTQTDLTLDMTGSSPEANMTSTTIPTSGNAVSFTLAGQTINVAHTGFLDSATENAQLYATEINNNTSLQALGVTASVDAGTLVINNGTTGDILLVTGPDVGKTGFPVSSSTAISSSNDGVTFTLDGYSITVQDSEFSDDDDFGNGVLDDGVNADGDGVDVTNTVTTNVQRYVDAINTAAIPGVTATVSGGEMVIHNNTTHTVALVTGTDVGQTGFPINTTTNIASSLDLNHIEVTVDELGKLRVANPGGSLSLDYDMNIKITALTATGITENEDFTRSMEALNAALPVGSGGIAYSQAFNAATHSSSIDIFDSLGSKHTVRMEFRKVALDTTTGSTWDMVVSVPPPATIDTVAPTWEKPGSVRFNNDGSLATYTPPNISFSGNNGSAPNQQVNLSFGTANAFDGMTSFDSVSATSGIAQDGYTGGDLVGIRIDQSGTLVGSFSNGRSFGLAQIAMSKFTNNEGLSAEGSNVYVQTANSGDPIIGTAATAGRGFIQSSALEASNVDLSRSLTELIVIQRGFQANGKTITTSDQLLQTLIGLKN